jgi:hypothetical protein
MRRLLLALVLISPLGCPPPGPTLKYTNHTPAEAAQAWARAFNAGDAQQLRLLVHPAQREEFPARRATLGLSRLTVQRYNLGIPLTVGEAGQGHEATFWYHDGVTATAREAVLVRFEGRWWLWSF